MANRVTLTSNQVHRSSHFYSSVSSRSSNVSGAWALWRAYSEIFRREAGQLPLGKFHTRSLKHIDEASLVTSRSNSSIPETNDRQNPDFVLGTNNRHSRSGPQRSELAQPEMPHFCCIAWTKSAIGRVCPAFT